MMRGAHAWFCRRLVILVLLSLGACAATDDTLLLDEPIMSSRWRHWETETPAKAAILALHGFNDYSNAFHDFATFANQHDIALHAYDQRGFGSDENAGRWGGTAPMVADLHQGLDHLRGRYPDTPLFVLGESMGGAVTLVAAGGEEPLAVDGLILVAPAVWGGNQFNPFYRASLWLAATLAPRWQLSSKGLDIWPSDNIEMLRAFVADPLVIKGTRADAIAGLVALMDEAEASLERLDQKTLILVGEKDQIVPSGAFDAMRAKLTAADCREIIYPEGYHMLLRDLQREVVYQDILTWIESGAAVGPTASDCRVASRHELVQSE